MQVLVVLSGSDVSVQVHASRGMCCILPETRLLQCTAIKR